MVLWWPLVKQSTTPWIFSGHNCINTVWLLPKLWENIGVVDCNNDLNSLNFLKSMPFDIWLLTWPPHPTNKVGFISLFSHFAMPIEKERNAIMPVSQEAFIFLQLHCLLSLLFVAKLPCPGYCLLVLSDLSLHRYKDSSTPITLGGFRSEENVPSL